MEARKKFVDSNGRHIHKLRLQLTDACNFRCFYCVPSNIKFQPSRDLLSAVEMLEICSHLVDVGIDEIRVSGGEPILRKDFETIIEGLSKLSLNRLGLTTNGFLLEEKLLFLNKTKCRNINVSLDSLSKKQFYEITKSDCFEKVHQSILKAKELGFRVKVNVVVMRGVNDEEIPDFVNFSRDHDIEVRFLELMKIGSSCGDHSRYFVSAQEMIKRIEQREELTPESVNQDSTSFNFSTSSGARIGIIASETMPFCCFCSRLRLMSTGHLRVCLMREDSVNLRGKEREEYPYLLKTLLLKKPVERISHIDQLMCKIGG